VPERYGPAIRIIIALFWALGTTLLRKSHVVAFQSDIYGSEEKWIIEMDRWSQFLHPVACIQQVTL